MKLVKNSLSPPKNSGGFILIYLALLLPLLLAIISGVYRAVYLIEFKNEFRFLCLTGSSDIQKLTLNSNFEVLTRAELLLQKLRSIKTPLNFYVTLSEFPKPELQNTENATLNLVYRLNYSWVNSESPAFSLVCGSQATKKEGQWQYEILYSTDAVRF